MSIKSDKESYGDCSITITRKDDLITCNINGEEQDLLFTISELLDSAKDRPNSVGQIIKDALGLTAVKKLAKLNHKQINTIN